MKIPSCESKLKPCLPLWDKNNLVTLQRNVDRKIRLVVDVSKYILTGVVISSLFKDFEDKVLIYIVGIALAFLCLVVGLILSNKKDGKGKKEKEK